MNKIQELRAKGLITPPPWLPDNVMYETYMGSMAYGTAREDSDLDLYGFCIPPKHIIFPHLVGHIIGFGQQPEKFEQYQAHHIADDKQEYDIHMYSIVKYFQLCMNNNPNMVDSLYTPQNCIITRTPVWELVRERRDLFIHKGCWHRFKGYAYNQLRLMETKDPKGKRKELIKQYGYDVKFAYHLVRLLLEVEQLLTEGTLDLLRNRKQLTAIRNGLWTQGKVKQFFYDKERQLEKVYHESSLPWGPDEMAIRDLLVECLQMHYGSVPVEKPDKYKRALLEVERIVSVCLRD